MDKFIHIYDLKESSAAYGPKIRPAYKNNYNFVIDKISEMRVLTRHIIEVLTTIESTTSNKITKEELKQLISLYKKLHDHFRGFKTKINKYVMNDF